jgi:Rnl2 family RNA ligase
MIFTKYSSIENSYRAKFLNQIAEQGKSGGEWVVTEKIHGSNFSLWFDGKELKAAKRKGFLNEPHQFYNADVVMDANRLGIQKIWNIITLMRNQIEVQGEDVPELKSITIYGELFGGSYPHPDVPRNPHAKRVQEGVYYSPDNLLYAFDIKINDDLCDYDTFATLCDDGQIFRTKPLFRGTLAECLIFKNAYKSTIPARLGLPELDVDNICEGNVISPVQPDFMFSGSRIIIKNKNEKFTEVAHGSTPKVLKDEVILSDECQRLFDIMNDHVTENRLKNVISKLGEITDKDFGLLMREMNHDVIEDFMKDNREDFLKLDKKEQKYMTKKVGSNNALLIRQNFLNIIDGEF